MPRSNYQPDPRLDLVLERIVDVPQELVWKAWTSPEHLKPWLLRRLGKRLIAKSIFGQAGFSGR